MIKQYEDTPGSWKDSPKVRSSAQVHDEHFKECITLQAHHFDLEFYDKFFEPGSYLNTHAKHMERWHPED